MAADRWATFAKATLAVSAKVEGKLIVDEEQFEVLMQKELDCVSISIYWEESGYKAYKALGLFGKMDTKYQEVRFKAGFMYVDGDKYKIRVRIPSDRISEE